MAPMERVSPMSLAWFIVSIILTLGGCIGTVFICAASGISGFIISLFLGLPECAVVGVVLMVTELSERRAGRKSPGGAGGEAPQADEGAVDPAALARVDALADDIIACSEAMHELLDFERGYLTRAEWESWRSDSAGLARELSALPERALRARSPVGEQAADIVRHWACADLASRRKEEFLEWERRNRAELFRDVGGAGRDLDREQTEAVVVCEDNTLVVAGAGSGKTLTVVGKVRYLVERYGISPGNIIVVSFTRDSSRELSDRIGAAGIDGVVVKDFHALGLSILDARPGVANESLLDTCVRGYIESEVARHPDQTKALLELYGYRSGAEEHCRAAQNSGSGASAVKASDMRTIKGMVEAVRTGMTTMQGERVKSFEELMIANFLYLNGVEYEYEKVFTEPIPQELDDGRHYRAYQPDFYLPEYDIWLEHFGVDERGRASFLKTPGERRRYEADMAWKRLLHETCGTRLIESYHYWYRDQDLINQLARVLEGNGVELVSAPERLAEIYSYLSSDRRFSDGVVRLVTQFIALSSVE